MEREKEKQEYPETTEDNGDNSDNQLKIDTENDSDSSDSNTHISTTTLYEIVQQNALPQNQMVLTKAFEKYSKNISTAAFDEGRKQGIMEGRNELIKTHKSDMKAEQKTNKEKSIRMEENNRVKMILELVHSQKNYNESMKNIKIHQTRNKMLQNELKEVDKTNLDVVDHLKQDLIRLQAECNHHRTHAKKFERYLINATKRLSRRVEMNIIDLDLSLIHI